MKRWIAGVAAMLCLSTQLIAQEDYATRAKRYVDKYKALAMEEQKRSGGPAAITLTTRRINVSLNMALLKIHTRTIQIT